MNFRALTLLLPFLNISLSYGCRQCSSIAKSLSNIATFIPPYRENITNVFQNFSSDNSLMITFFRNVSTNCQTMDYELNKIASYFIPTPFEDEESCCMESLEVVLQKINMHFQMLLQQPQEHEALEEVFLCKDLPSLLEKIVPPSDFIKNIQELCSEICTNDDDYDFRLSNAVLFLSSYQTFSQTLANSSATAFSVLDEIIQKNKDAFFKNFGLCWSCNEESLQKICLILQVHYSKFSNILAETLQRLQTFQPPLPLEITTQMPLVNQKGQSLAMIEQDPQRKYFIFENDQFFFPTLENWWNFEINAEEKKEILIPVIVDPFLKKIISPEKFKDAPSPRRVYVALEDVTHKINDNLALSLEILNLVKKNIKLPNASSQ